MSGASGSPTGTGLTRPDPIAAVNIRRAAVRPMGRPLGLGAQASTDAAGSPLAELLLEPSLANVRPGSAADMAGSNRQPGWIMGGCTGVRLALTPSLPSAPLSYPGSARCQAPNAHKADGAAASSRSSLLLARCTSASTHARFMFLEPKQRWVARGRIVICRQNFPMHYGVNARLWATHENDW